MTDHHHVMSWEGEYEVYCGLSEYFFEAELGEMQCPECGGKFRVIEKWHAIDTNK